MSFRVACNAHPTFLQLIFALPFTAGRNSCATQEQFSKLVLSSKTHRYANNFLVFSPLTQADAVIDELEHILHGMLTISFGEDAGFVSMAHLHCACLRDVAANPYCRC